MNTASKSADAQQTPSVLPLAGRRSPVRPFLASTIMLAIYMFTVIAWSQASTASAFYSKLAGLGLTFVFVIEFLLSKTRTVKLPIEAVCLVLFLLWNLYSLFWARDQSWAFTTIKTLAQLLVFWFVSVNVMVCYGSIAPSGVGLLVGLAWAMINAVRSNAMSLTTAERIGGLLENANAYAVALTVGVITTLYLYSFSPRLSRWLLIVFAALAVQQIFFFSGSRKGMIGVVAAVAVYYVVTLILDGRDRPGQIVLLMVGVVAAYFIVAWLISNSPFGERLFGLRQEASFVTRRSLMQFALDQWQRAPIIGHGSNQFRVLFESQFGINTYSHNNYLEVLVNTGALGALLFYSFYAVVAARYAAVFARHSGTTPALAWAATLLVVFLLWDFAMVSYADKLYWIIFAQVSAQLELLSRAPGRAKASPDKLGMRPAQPFYPPTHIT